jgi:uncharacterized protein
MSYLLRIILILLFIWLIRRLVYAFMGTARKTPAKSNPADAKNYMVKDPVCGMYMDSRLAIRLEKGKDSVYFCSEECKKKYLNQSEKGNPDASASNK